MTLAKKQRDGAGPALGSASRLCLRPGCQAHVAGPRGGSRPQAGGQHARRSHPVPQLLSRTRSTALGRV